MSGWKEEEEEEEEEENGTNMQQDQLKSQGTIYLSEDLQDARKEDGVTWSLIKTGGFAYNKEEGKEEEEEEDL